MEFFLNIAWLLLAAGMIVLWLRTDSRSGTDRRMQIVALGVLLLILFPVISVTDDLQAQQNPAETDCCQRRGHAYATPHSLLSPVAALPLPPVAQLSFGISRMAAPGRLDAPVFDHPALMPIQSQPPPAA
jgi:hypothetical protein